MNILHMKYAVEVAGAGSINKASEKLLVAQPNLSRSIKELESDLGIVIFDRSSRGMVLTPEGEEFIRHAKRILQEINDVENMFRSEEPKAQKLSIFAPRLSCISDVFVRFAAGLGGDQTELSYRETTPNEILAGLSAEECDLGIMRYAVSFDKYFKAIFDERGFACEQIGEVPSGIVIGPASPLAAKEKITLADLESYTEIKHTDPYISSIPMALVKKEALPSNTASKVDVNERATQFELLASDGRYFVWASKIPDGIKQRYGLAEKECEDFRKISKDVIIYKKASGLSPLARRFADMLKEEGGRRS